MSASLGIALYAAIGISVTLYAVRRWPDVWLQETNEWGATVPNRDGHQWMALLSMWPLFVGAFVIAQAVSATHRFFVWYAPPTQDPDAPNAD